MDIHRCYELLELDINATPKEVGKAYKQLVFVWHPDRFPEKKELRKKAEERTKELNLAKTNILEYLKSNPDGPPPLNPEADQITPLMGKALDFIKECCEIGSHCRVDCVKLSMAYSNWCYVKKITPISNRAFDKQLKELGFTHLEENVGNEFYDTYWNGLDLNQQWSELWGQKKEALDKIFSAKNESNFSSGYENGNDAPNGEDEDYVFEGIDENIDTRKESVNPFLDQNGNSLF